MNKPDNMSLHSDMRQFLLYIQTNHGNTFRYLFLDKDKDL